MSEAKAPEESIAEQLNLKDGDYVQEFGYDDDVDADLRERIEAAIGSELFDEDAQEVVDAVVLWWRSDDGDVADLKCPVAVRDRDRRAGAPGDLLGEFGEHRLGVGVRLVLEADDGAVSTWVVVTDRADEEIRRPLFGTAHGLEMGDDVQWFIDHPSMGHAAAGSFGDHAASLGRMG